MSNKPGFFRQLKDTQNYSTKFLIVLFSPNSGVTPYWPFSYVLIDFYTLLAVFLRFNRFLYVISRFLTPKSVLNILMA